MHEELGDFAGFADLAQRRVVRLSDFEGECYGGLPFADGGDGAGAAPVEEGPELLWSEGKGVISLWKRKGGEGVNDLGYRICFGWLFRLSQFGRAR